jgi:CheY-like chemotaxis protein/AraC-like DNA-binding protein
MNYSKTDLRNFLEELSPLFYDYIHTKHIEFGILAQPDSSYEMVFDKEKMEKIYFNLLSNAFKYVNTGGKVSIELYKAENYIQLIAFNTGSFIPIEEQKNIFDRFYRLENQNNSTGIGLALVSSLVEMHGGSIEVESRIDEGTRFSIKFPLVQLPIYPEKTVGYKGGEYIRMKIGDEIQKNYDEFLAERDGQNEKPLILVIEDNADMRHYMRNVLWDEYQISEAEDGTDGIEKAIKHIPDLVISDVMMPGKDGFEVCRTLKENISTSHIPVILLTACALDEQKAAGFESGAEAYIPKPFNPELLKIRIRKLIENRRKIQEFFGTTGIVSTTKRATLADMEQDFIDHFKAHVEKNITNPELNVDDIAKSLGLSRVQLYRKLRSLTDYTPNELIRIIRLKHAIRLLSTRSKSIAEVAYESGFSSPSYFTKCFKEQYNVNPTDYLK